MAQALARDTAEGEAYVFMHSYANDTAEAEANVFMHSYANDHAGFGISKSQPEKDGQLWMLCIISASKLDRTVRQQILRKSGPKKVAQIAHAKAGTIP